ncbi:MAG TPA: YbaB/EbfC family nucleoid-associated protein [bacterium]|nr:YbaB/EbfC family nucleoid-associated protein [bacterium]
MFNKLKQLKDLKDQAKVMQTALSGEKITVEKRGVTIEMNGNMEVLSIVISPDLAKEAIAEASKIAINEAIKKTQQVMAKKMQEMGGLAGLGL